MIAAQELRRTARERRLALDLVEKDYVLGWILFGVSASSVSRSLAFKGGTALSPHLVCFEDGVLGCR